MIPFHHFFWSLFLEYLSVECWITWMDSLIFWAPLSSCPCVCLFALLSRSFIFQPFCWVFISALPVLFNYQDLFVCSFAFFIPLFLVSWLYCVLIKLKGYWVWDEDGKIVSNFFFSALPVLLSFLFLLFWFLSGWVLSLSTWRSSAVCLYLRVKYQKSKRQFHE